MVGPGGPILEWVWGVVWELEIGGGSVCNTRISDEVLTLPSCAQISLSKLEGGNLYCFPEQGSNKPESGDVGN